MASYSKISAVLLGVYVATVVVHPFQFTTSPSKQRRRYTTSPLRDGRDGSSGGEQDAVISSRAADAGSWVEQDITEQLATTSTTFLEDANPVRGPSKVLIYDTTLRDGTQMESISVSCDDKLKIAKRLSSFDVDFIEAGWPGSNPKDEEFFRRARTELDETTKSKLVAFGSTRRKNIEASEDKQIQTLVESGAPTVCIVAKAHLWQGTDIIRADPEENLEMIFDSVSYLASQGIQVMVDLEHFFDGYKFDSEYTLKCCQAAVDGGASVLVMCDTNGGSMPWQVSDDNLFPFPSDISSLE